jgi:peptidoglycan/LPS O-acetylase OafA/YrhL
MSRWGGGQRLIKLTGILPRRGDTIASALDRHRGVGPGFDVLRIVLAIMVFWVHTGALNQPRTTAVVLQAAKIGPQAFVAAAHTTAWDGWLRPILVAILPKFFGLSGFLVCGSALRLRRISTFLVFRGLRLWPALLTEITLSALVLGPVFTRFSLQEYFSNPDVYKYFQNIIGVIKYTLPGVFDSSVHGVVNGNLRTLPSEFYCYLAVAVLMYSRILFNRAAVSIIFISITAILVPLNLLGSFAVSGTFVTDETLLYYFLFEIVFFLWRDKIPLRVDLFVLSSALAFLLLEFHHTVFIAPIFLTYSMTFLGMLAIPRLPLIRTGDYSYGIYLYGFPISQACLAVAPRLVGHRLAIFAVGLVVTCLFAVFSWHVIEKPGLRLKNAMPAWLFPPQARVPGLLQEPAPQSSEGAGAR